MRNPGTGAAAVLAAAIDPRYRAFVLLAVFGSLRWGELMGLRRSDFGRTSFQTDVGYFSRIPRMVSELAQKDVSRRGATPTRIASRYW